MKTSLGLFLTHKEFEKLKVYLSKSNKYNHKTNQCIDAAILSYCANI